MAGFDSKKRKSSPRKSFKYEDAPERSSSRPFNKSPRGDSGSVVDMVKKMQQQLIYLERKLDILIEQSGVKPSRSEGSSGRQGRGAWDSSSRETNFTKGKKPFLQKRKPRS